MRAYLDNSSTTFQSSEVTEAVVAAAELEYGNPSSLHRLGMNSEKLLKNARKKACALTGAADDEIYFTSGGTESDNTAIFGAYMMLRRQGNHIITSKTEHPAVLECMKRLEQFGAEVTYLDVDSMGYIDTAQLEAALREDTILVSIMHVNNENGAVQPVKEIGEIVKKSEKAVFHCDAVQSYGKLPINVHDWNIDILAGSGHKIHGPKGTGIIYVNKSVHLPSFMCGGGQEKGFRSGTENVPGIAGFGKASELAAANMKKNYQHVTEMRDRLLQGIKSEIQDVMINTPVENGERCLPHILNVSFAGTRGEVILHMLEQSKIYVSTGSACSTHKKGVNRVLTAMGRTPDEIEGTLRFSLSCYNTLEEIDYTIEKLKKAVADNRKMLAIAAKMGR